jgi:hypothetical protein
MIKQSLSLLTVIILSAPPLLAQKKSEKSVKPQKPKKVAATPYVPGPLFQTDEVLHFKLSGRLREIFNDRSSELPTYHPIRLQFKKKDSTLSIPVLVRTRGNFRRREENCAMPPLLINIEKLARLKSSVFEKQDKLKLVTPCKTDDYVIREYLVYKIYNLLTPYSFKARLAQVGFEDSLQKRKLETKYCILIEDEGKLAKRNGMFLWERKFVQMEKLRTDEFLKTALFEYLIGNTDWDVSYLHNIKLLYRDSTTIPTAVPYDFDHSGIVNAGYALPAEQLGIVSVRDRLYRGYCLDKSAFTETIALFNKFKNDIYSIYTSCNLLDGKYIKNTLKYLDEFYKTINNPREAEKELTMPCRLKERIVIKGYN